MPCKEIRGAQTCIEDKEDHEACKSAMLEIGFHIVCNSGLYVREGAETQVT